MGKPTIKGIFVLSHIKAVRHAKGEAGIRELKERYGQPLNFKNSDNVPVREEVKLIECALDVMSTTPIPPESTAFEAGRLHFRNFTTTPLGRLVFSFYRKKFKMLMLRAENIAGHVFRGVQFTSVDLGPSAVKVIMENNDYPIDHFRGLFQEWMNFAGLTGVVEAAETAPNRYEYTMRWEGL